MIRDGGGRGSGEESPAGPRTHRLRFADYEVDLSEHRLTRSGRRIGLQEQPFRVLVLLLGRPGELVSRDEIQHAIWPDGTTVDFDRGLNTAVNKLRGALRDTAATPRFIETVPRLGYRFLAPVEVVPEAGQDAEGLESPPFAPRRRPAIWIASALCVVAILLTIAMIGSIREPRVRATGTRSSLAVLPFENLSGDPDQRFFSAGLTQEMTSRLGRLAPAELGVIARTTMMAYEGTRRPVAEIAAELDVDYVLEGSLRRTRDRVRITAQLIRASDQTHMWSADYDSHIEDILAIQAEVAERIAESLVVEVLPKPRLSSPVDPVAYESYLRGLHFRDMLTEVGYRKAIESFEEAISRDPDFAPAYAAMSACYCLLAGHGLEVAEPNRLMPPTREFAERALALDRTLADAQGALGMAYFKHDWDWVRAEDALRRATRSNPSEPIARIWYSFLLGSQERHEEARAQLEEAKRIDPFSRVVNANLGWQRYEARQYEQAEASFSETLELFPGFWAAHWGRGLSRLQLGIREQALADLRLAAELSNDNPAAVAALGFAHAILGEREQALAILESLLRREETQYVPAVTFVGIYGALGDVDRAFQWLERAHEQRSRSMAWMRVAHEFDSLRDDARFTAMLERMNLDE